MVSMVDFVCHFVFTTICLRPFLYDLYLPLYIYDFLLVGEVGGWGWLVHWWWVWLVGEGLPLFVNYFLFTTFCWWVGLTGVLVS